MCMPACEWSADMCSHYHEQPSLGHNWLEMSKDFPVVEQQGSLYCSYQTWDNNRQQRIMAWSMAFCVFWWDILLLCANIQLLPMVQSKTVNTPSVGTRYTKQKIYSTWRIYSHVFMRSDRLLEYWYIVETKKMRSKSLYVHWRSKIVPSRIFKEQWCFRITLSMLFKSFCYKSRIKLEHGSNQKDLIRKQT